jgi:hypothetical protein
MAWLVDVNGSDGLLWKYGAQATSETLFLGPTDSLTEQEQTGSATDAIYAQHRRACSEKVGRFRWSEGFSQAIPLSGGLPRLILLLFGGIPNSPSVLKCVQWEW